FLRHAHGAAFPGFRFPGKQVNGLRFKVQLLDPKLEKLALAEAVGVGRGDNCSEHLAFACFHELVVAFGSKESGPGSAFLQPWRKHRNVCNLRWRGLRGLLEHGVEYLELTVDRA